ncbi:restriction endonuclease subunit S [Citrobacter freundii]|uniref:restriction endonuclease subunit S n=1 Tax=Citrobacter freundii TaxID=546 RepID=UPI000D11F235|nr:restriction endonuclease subunit S [Citrobacter freundii]PSM61011.1 restriction endonuclease subunit S [Citrobacter freundii]
MVSNWTLTRLADVIEQVIDNRGRNPENYTEVGIPVIDNVLIKSQGVIDLSMARRFINQNTYDNFLRKYLEPDDVLLTLVGNGYGQVAITPNDTCAIIQNTIGLRCKEGFSNKYLYYLLKFNLGTLRNLDRGAAQPSIKVGDILDLEFYFPDFSNQTSISKILYILDKKINLNNQINQTLEKISQALFKSWFVDFDPVIDNALDAGNPVPEALQSRAELRQKVRNSADFKPLPADIRVLFPAEFEETELGWVPKGWKEGSIPDIAFINSTSWGTKNQPDYVNYVDLSNAKDGIISSIENIPFEDAPSRARRILKKDDLIFGLVRPANRSFAYVHADGLTGSTGFAVVRAKNTIYKNFIYYFVTYDKNVEELARIADGGAYPAIKPDDICSLPLIIPPEEIVQKYDESTRRFRDLMNNSLVQNDYLTNLRDTLLPKLISGELSLEDLPNLVDQTEPA